MFLSSFRSLSVTYTQAYITRKSSLAKTLLDYSYVYNLFLKVKPNKEVEISSSGKNQQQKDSEKLVQKFAQSILLLYRKQLMIMNARRNSETCAFGK